jgi:hypothetical protein
MATVIHDKTVPMRPVERVLFDTLRELEDADPTIRKIASVEGVEKLLISAPQRRTQLQRVWYRFAFGGEQVQEDSHQPSISAFAIPSIIIASILGLFALGRSAGDRDSKSRKT